MQNQAPDLITAPSTTIIVMVAALSGIGITKKELEIKTPVIRIDTRLVLVPTWMMITMTYPRTFPNSLHQTSDMH